MEAGLSLGSNQGDRAGYFRQALNRLARIAGVRVLAKSRLYETEPMGVPDAFREMQFLNAVVLIEWPGSARELLREAKALEKAAGRKATVRNGPRPLDVDIVYADGMRIEEPDLSVPHPRAKERRFVLEPLAELRPDLVPPGWEESISEALKRLPPQGVRVWREEWE